MDSGENDVVVPVVSEQLHADAVPVQTGGVRVTKHVEGHDEIIEQELRKGRVEIKRVKTERVVDGPQPAQRVGKTLIVPVVSEVLRIEKQWVVTEEIHLTQVEELETVQQKVRVNQEQAEVERLDESGNVVESVGPAEENEPNRRAASTIVGRSSAAAAGQQNRVLSSGRSLLRKTPSDLKKS